VVFMSCCVACTLPCGSTYNSRTLSFAWRVPECGLRLSCLGPLGACKAPSSRTASGSRQSVRVAFVQFSMSVRTAFGVTRLTVPINFTTNNGSHIGDPPTPWGGSFAVSRIGVRAFGRGVGRGR